jgi:hypothetical protein
MDLAAELEIDAWLASRLSSLPELGDNHKTQDNDGPHTSALAECGPLCLGGTELLTLQYQWE